MGQELDFRQIRNYFLLKDSLMMLAGVLIAVGIAAVFTAIMGLTPWTIIVTALVSLASSASFLLIFFTRITKQMKKYTAEHPELSSEPRDVVVARLKALARRDILAQTGFSLAAAGLVIIFANRSQPNAMWTGVSLILVAALFDWFYYRASVSYLKKSGETRR